MTLLKRLLLALTGLVIAYFCFAGWFIVASDYSDHIAIGEYDLSDQQERSHLTLKGNHTFVQQVTRHGKTATAEGTWRLFGQGHLAFSKEFLVVSGQDLSADGTAYGTIHKAFGIAPISIELSHYHVLWYGRRDPSASSPIAGTYVGDEEHAPSTLVMREDHTFEQVVTHDGKTAQANGTWQLNQEGDIVFSREFLKSSGRPLAAEERASAWNPQGSNLQIEISVHSTSGPPIFWKRLFR